jgi:transcriptional regulator with XRE-family HTH domain
MKTSVYSIEYVALREWLVNARSTRGLTIRELGERLDIHHSIIGKIESGGRKLDVIEFVKYCQALGVSPADGLEAVLAAANKRAGKKR